MKSGIDKPTVYVIAGPNGAGKTTFAQEFLPTFVNCREFVNADLIAAGLSPFAAETQNLRAGRLMLERIRELAAKRADFGFETTLAGRTYRKLLADMRESGYRVELFFLWLPNAEFAIERVESRVRQGGHNVPVEDVKRRFAIGLTNLFAFYRPILDTWRLYDAVSLPPRVIAFENAGKLTVERNEVYVQIVRQAERTDVE